MRYIDGLNIIARGHYILLNNHYGAKPLTLMVVKCKNNIFICNVLQHKCKNYIPVKAICFLKQTS